MFLGAVLGGALAGFAQSDPGTGAIAGGAFTALARALAASVSTRKKRDNNNNNSSSPTGGGKEK